MPPIQKENSGQGPYPFSIAKAKALLTSHGWSEVGGVMTCQDPSKCGTGITKGQQLKFTFVYSTGHGRGHGDVAGLQVGRQSKAGIDINLVGQTFNTIIGESAPCSPMGPKCNVQVFAFGGWGFDGPGFEPTGEPLFATGAGSNSGNYSDPTMDKLINATHTSNSLAASTTTPRTGRSSCRSSGCPSPTRTAIQAVSSKLHERHVQPAVHACFPSTGTSPSSRDVVGKQYKALAAAAPPSRGRGRQPGRAHAA